jgi:hypothetical protein
VLSIVTGLAAGALHVVSGPDHVAAMAPLAAHSPRRATLLGFKWGIGHGIGACTLGLLGVVARDAVDVEALSRGAELLVGFMLVGIGLWAFRRARALVVHAHTHSHDGGEPHQHLHVHEDGVHREGQRASHQHSHAALYVGMLHGSAGSGHAFAVLPSLALPTTAAVAYLASYFVAAVVAMTAFGAAMGRVARGRRPERLRHLMYASSFAAVGVGLFWVGSNWPA